MFEEQKKKTLEIEVSCIKLSLDNLAKDINNNPTTLNHTK